MAIVQEAIGHEKPVAYSMDFRTLQRTRTGREKSDFCSFRQPKRTLRIFILSAATNHRMTVRRRCAHSI
jgi:hypothetical protein